MRYVIRIISPAELDSTTALSRIGWLPPAWMEVVSKAELGYLHVAEKTDDDYVFDLFAPEGLSDRQTAAWAHREAERMQSFGYNAAAAPEWRTSTYKVENRPEGWFWIDEDGTAHGPYDRRSTCLHDADCDNVRQVFACTTCGNEHGRAPDKCAQCGAGEFVQREASR